MKLWGLSDSEKSNIQEAYLPKTSILVQIVSEILTKSSTSAHGKNLVCQKNSLGTCIPFDIKF